MSILIFPRTVLILKSSLIKRYLFENQMKIKTRAIVSNYVNWGRVEVVCLDHRGEQSLDKSVFAERVAIQRQ
jgi:hypothetical protein